MSFYFFELNECQDEDAEMELDLLYLMRGSDAYTGKSDLVREGNQQKSLYLEVRKSIVCITE